MQFYLDGRWVEESEARVSVNDHGFLYGDGCFETVGVADGRLIHLDDHVARFFRSAKMLRLVLPFGPVELGDLIVEAARKNALASVDGSLLRIVVTRGTGPTGVGKSHLVTHPTVVIIPSLPDQPRDPFAPVQVLSAALTHVERPSSATLDARVKTLNYLSSILAFLDARQKGADVGILRDPDGFVAEGHGMNLFCVQSGTLLTPFATFALAGVVRGHVIQAAAALGFPCEERNLTPYDFVCADEAFCTGGTDVSALGSIDGSALPHPVPGKITLEVADAYRRSALGQGTPIG
jgi:branched-chain amino acid aminotransferase